MKKFIAIAFTIVITLISGAHYSASTVTKVGTVTTHTVSKTGTVSDTTTTYNGSVMDSRTTTITTKGTKTVTHSVLDTKSDTATIDSDMTTKTAHVVSHTVRKGKVTTNYTEHRSLKTGKLTVTTSTTTIK